MLEMILYQKFTILKTYISGRAGGAGVSFTTPVNCKYVRVSLSITNINIYQLEQGAVSTSYEQYKTIHPKRNIGRQRFSVSAIPNESILKL